MSDSNGNGHPKDDDGARSFEVVGDATRPINRSLERLVRVLLEECVKRGYERIEITLADDGCPTHLERGDVKLPMDTMPRWLFEPFKAQVARMCGMKQPAGEGKFSASLKRAETSARPYCEMYVSAVLGESTVQLAITDVRKLPS